MRSQPSSPRRLGFGIIELLVVIAIIAILIALLVPAVSKVREAAMRTQSTNNLKNIMLSFHGFHDTWKHLPFNGSDTAVGGQKYSAAAIGKDPRSGSWAFQILPFVEQQAMFDNLDRKHPVPPYLCPGRARPGVETSNDGGAWCDYFYNNYLNNAKQAEKANNADAKLMLARLNDGSSNTIGVGHGNINMTQYKDNADVTLCTNIFKGGTFGTARAGKNGEANPEGVTLQRDSAKAPGSGSWGGPFPRGALMGMCDASVRMFPYDTQNFGAFLTPNGGEAVNLPCD